MNVTNRIKQHGCVNRAKSIPSPRHRAKTAPQEQSIRFPLLYLTCKRKLELTFVTAISFLHYTSWYKVAKTYV
jgi:hypothetical protein